jgi:hypothetical protein
MVWVLPRQTKDAVEAGYWQLYRYNPLLEAEGKNPFQLDSKNQIGASSRTFLASEVRYSSLKKAFPKKLRAVSKLPRKMQNGAMNLQALCFYGFLQNPGILKIIRAAIWLPFFYALSPGIPLLHSCFLEGLILIFNCLALTECL